MLEDILGVSWLHGRMRFASVPKGQTEPAATWECKGDVEGLETGEFNLAPILKEAVTHTGYRGKKVAIVLEHSRLTEQLLETPPTSGRELGGFVQRQVDDLKISDEEVVASWQVTHPIKLSQGLMLYLMPKSLHDRLITDCRLAGLQLVVLASPTALLSNQLSQLSLGEDEIGLIAADTGGTTAVVVGREEGPVFLTRSLRCRLEGDPQRLAMQMNRSIAFVKQQYLADVASIWLYGEGAQTHAAPISEGVALPVKPSPVAFTPFYWTEQVVQFPAEAETNLISMQVRQAPKRKFFAKIAAVLLSLQMLLSIGVFAVIKAQVRKEVSEVTALQSRTVALESRKTTMEKSLAELNRKKELIKLIDENKAAPVPYWFLSYVADVIPDHLLLTELQVSRPKVDSRKKKKNTLPEDYWVVRLEGTNRPMAAVRPDDAQKALTALLDKLENGPFRLTVSGHTRAYAPRTARSTGFAVSGSASRSRDLFFIEGTMRANTLQ